MKSSINHLSESIVIEALARDNSKVSFAQEGGGLMSSIVQNVKDYIMSVFDKDRPVSSIVAFIGPGLLWRLGFPWLATLYTVAEALGFDWKGFWSSVGSEIGQFTNGILSSGNKVSEEEASQKVNDIVQRGFEAHYTGEEDLSKLSDMAKKKALSEKIKDNLELKALALRLDKNSKFLKEAGLFGGLFRKLSRFFIGKISWLITTALISLGFVAAAGAVKGVIDYTKKPSEDGESSSGENSFVSNTTIEQSKVSPNVSADMFSVHPNDLSSIWMEHGDIGDIDNIIINWILDAFPDLSNKVDSIKSSSVFQTMVKRFKDRNSLSDGLGVISVPRPYERKIDVVSPIVAQFVSK